MTFLYILLFIVCLSTLIMVHEAGHLMTAKIFKVYCFEYAIGFGPRLLSFKRKNGETRFSIRAIPFGGFVSMYGEAELVPEDVGPIDESRSINHIAKWKRAIIMTAGIIMNFVLALVIFFIYEFAFPAYTARVAHITVKEKINNQTTIAYNAGLRSKDYLYTPTLGNYIFYDDEAVITRNDESTVKVYFGYDYSTITLKDQAIYSRAVAFQRQNYGEITLDYTDISYEEALNGDFSGDEVVINRISGYIGAYAANEIKGDKNNYLLRVAILENYLDKAEKAVYADYVMSKDEYNARFKYVPVGAFITFVGDFSTDSYGNFIQAKQFATSYPLISTGNMFNSKTGVALNKFNSTVYVLNEVNNNYKGDPISFECPISSNGKPDKQLGLYMQLDSHQNSYGTAVGNTFKDFGNAATLIYRGLGSLFTKEGIGNIGGIIAIGVSTTQILQTEGFGLFLFYWALISVNLGIVNLLPFPGLDGWHFLVTIVEGITHKEIPSKVKNIISAIGIVILLTIMVLILIKDIITVI